MINKIAFLNNQLILPILLGAGILLAAFIWKEWAQAGKRRLFLKILLIFLAIGSLLLIALKPALPATETTGKFVLLTEAFHEDLLDSLQKEHRELQVIDYSPGQPIPEELISSEKVFILGHGVKDYDLWQLDDVPATYMGGNSPEGVVALQFSQENSVGDSLVLKGLYKIPNPGNRLVLQEPGGAGLDSLVFNSEEDRRFQLSAALKVPGNFVYTLAEKDSLGEILNSDPVPVKVSENENLRILVINSFPTFETKYLKNFLAEAGHELVVRSRITRGRYKFEYFNTSRSRIGTLSESSLEPFDLLIIDAASWRNLPRGQATAVENAVRADGLGIFIQPDENFFRSPGDLANLDFERVQPSEIRFPQWPGIDINRFSFRIKDENGLQIIHNDNDEVISGYKRVEQGRVGTTVLSTTWQLVLEGNQEVYRHLWSQLVEQVSKRKDQGAEWEQEAMIAYPHEPFHFQLRTAATAPDLKNAEGKPVPIQQDVNIPTLWKGTTWPGESGWSRIQLDTTAVFDYYVAPEDAWSALTASKIINANQRNFDREEKTGQRERPLLPINPLWFYGLFLIGMGGLWLEPKV